MQSTQVLEGRNIRRLFFYAGGNCIVFDEAVYLPSCKQELYEKLGRNIYKSQELIPNTVFNNNELYISRKISLWIFCMQERITIS